jgi:hypothetical protein
MSPEPECHCGHVLDEHAPDGKKCCIEGCDCIYFEENPDANEQ